MKHSLKSDVKTVNTKTLPLHTKIGKTWLPHRNFQLTYRYLVYISLLAACSTTAL